MKRFFSTLFAILLFISVSYAGNTHKVASEARERQAWWNDAFDGWVVSGCSPSVPAASLTITAFSCKAYAKDNGELYYIDQPSNSITVPNSATVWLAIHRDRTSTVSGWTRVALTHYLYQANASQPATPTGGLIFAKVTVAASVISAIEDRRRSNPVPGNIAFVTDPIFGAVADDNTDDASAIQSAVTRAASTQQTVYIPSGTFNIKSPITVSSPLTIKMALGTTLDLTGIAGTGVANVHQSVNVLAGFVVSADNVIIEGGHITGPATSDGGKNVVGILDQGTDRLIVRNIRIDSMYNSVWIGGGATNIRLEGLDLDGLSHNLKLGYDEQVGSDPQITGITVLNIDSKNSTNDGLKTESYVRNLEIIGGRYHSNTRDGIDLYISGEYVSVTGVLSYDNTINGIDPKYSSATGTGAGDGGYNRRVIIANNIFRNNTQNGVRISGYDDGAVLIRPEGFIVRGNISQGNGTAGFDITAVRSVLEGNVAIGNGGRGFNILSSEHMVIANNIADQNNTVSQTEGFNFGLRSGAVTPKNAYLTVTGNHAYGSGVASGQQVGFSVTDTGIEKSLFAHNAATNHNSNNWSVTVTGMTEMTFVNNYGWTTQSMAQITADQNDYAIAEGEVVRIYSDASRTITGIVASPGRIVTLVNRGSQDIVFANQNAGSSAANRIITGTGANLTVSGDGSVTLVYDNTESRWRVIN